jgi:hypothetical protein
MAVEPSWTGVVAHLHVTARAFLPMRAQEAIELVAGHGILGDRYMLSVEQGFYSEKPEEGRQVTLFEEEALEAIRRDYGIEMSPAEHRRNVTTRGVALNHLVDAASAWARACWRRRACPCPAGTSRRSWKSLSSTRWCTAPASTAASSRAARSAWRSHPARREARPNGRAGGGAAGPGVRRLVLMDPDGWPLPKAKPGAHIDLHLPGGMVRAYSLCGESRAAGPLRPRA